MTEEDKMQWEKWICEGWGKSCEEKEIEEEKRTYGEEKYGGQERRNGRKIE